MTVLKKYENARRSSSGSVTIGGSAPEVINVVAFPGVEGTSAHYEKLFDVLLTQYAKETSEMGYGIPKLQCYRLSDPRVTDQGRDDSPRSRPDYTSKGLAFQFVDSIEANLRGPCIFIGYSSYAARLGFIAASALQTKLVQGGGVPGLGPFSFISIDGSSPQLLEAIPAKERAEMMLDVLRYFFKAAIECEFGEISVSQQQALSNMPLGEQVSALKEIVRAKLRVAAEKFTAKKRQIDAFQKRLEQFILPNMQESFRMVDTMSFDNCCVLTTESSQASEKVRLDKNFFTVFRAETSEERLIEYLNLICQSNGLHDVKNQFELNENEIDFSSTMELLRSQLQRVIPIKDQNTDALRSSILDEIKAIEAKFASRPESIETDDWYTFLKKRDCVSKILEHMALSLGWDTNSQCLVAGDHYTLLDNQKSLHDISEKVMYAVYFHYKHVLQRMLARVLTVVEFGKKHLPEGFLEARQEQPINKVPHDVYSKNTDARGMAHMLSKSAAMFNSTNRGKAYGDRCPDDPLSCSPPDRLGGFTHYLRARGQGSQGFS